MFQQRLIREEDALLIGETLAFLIRQSGQPIRPKVPSPLVRNRTPDSRAFDQNDARPACDWAHDSLNHLLDEMKIEQTDLRLVASTHPASDDHNVIFYDPSRVHEPGHFVCRLVLQLVEHRIRAFNPGRKISTAQRALIRLTACAYFRQGFALTHYAPVLTKELGAGTLPQRLVENALVFSSCLALTVLRQSPEQIIATYGSLMSQSVRRKIRPACRQIEGLEAEVKLLRVITSKAQSSALPTERSRTARRA